MAGVILFIQRYFPRPDDLGQPEFSSAAFKGHTARRYPLIPENAPGGQEENGSQRQEHKAQQGCDQPPSHGITGLQVFPEIVQREHPRAKANSAS